jgi:hypothetical protein
MPDYGDVNPETGQSNLRTNTAGSVDPLAPSVSNGQISPAQWAEYQTKRRRDAIMGLVGTLGGMFGGSALSAGLGGYGAGAGAAAGGGGSLGAVSGGAPWAVTPYAANSATMVGTGLSGGAAGAASGGVGAAAKFLGLSPNDWASIVPAAVGTIGSAVSKPPNMNPTTATTDPNLQKLLQTMQGRLDQSEPLYKSIMAMANGLLPTQYQNGGAGR